MSFKSFSESQAAPNNEKMKTAPGDDKTKTAPAQKSAAPAQKS